jgi:hypothetical protein
VRVVSCQAGEVGFVEAPFGLGARCRGLGHEGLDAGVFARLESGARWRPVGRLQGVGVALDALLDLLLAAIDLVGGEVAIAAVA